MSGIGWSRPVRAVCFDSSAFSQLWRSKSVEQRRLHRVRRRLGSAKHGRQPRVAIGSALILGIARIRPRELGRKELTLPRSLPEARFLKDARRRTLAEIEAATVRDSSLFVSEEFQRARLEGAAPMPEMWEAEEDALMSEKQTFADEERKSRDGILSDVSRQAELARQVTGWYSDPEATMSEWARDNMRSRRDDLGLPEDEIVWPDPQSLPTIWGTWAYRTAQIHLSNRDARAVSPNDLPDWKQHAAAMHAAVLVVDDKKFRAIAEVALPPKPEMITSEEFIRRMLVTAS